MGTHFFQKGPKAIGGGSQNLTARAIGAPGYAGRAAGVERTKDLAAALAIGKNKAPLAKSERSGVYPKGPKL